MISRALAAVLVLLAVWAAGPGASHAQPKPRPKPAPQAEPAPAEDPKKVEAKERFERGVSRMTEEAWDVALAEFQRSLELFPTRSATKNAAICLRKLRRFDESMELFERLVRAFPDLPTEDRAFAEKNLTELKAVVGRIEVRGAEPGATVSVDGRERGEVNLKAPMRVSAGTRMVRVYKPGFSPVEKRIEVPGEQGVIVDARMTALTSSGRLQVSEASGQSLDVVVDDVVVGKTPWEGELAVGEHVVVLRGEGNLGSAPVATSVKLGGVTPLSLTARELDAGLDIEATPSGARVALDGVPLGSSRWTGRLPSGAHEVSITAEGFLPAKRTVTLGTGGREVLAVRLVRDPGSPIWGDEDRSRFVIELVGGAAIAPSLGGTVAGDCASPCSKDLGLGFSGRLHVAYQLDNGLLFGLTGGYLLLGQSVTGTPVTVSPVGRPPNQGTDDDALRLGGVLVGATGGYHMGDRFPLTLRLGAGVLLGSLEDERTGHFTSSTGAAYDLSISESPAARYFQLAPEVRFGVRLADRFELSLGIEAMVLFAIEQPVASATMDDAQSPGDGLVPLYGFSPAEELSASTLLFVVPSAAIRADF